MKKLLTVLAVIVLVANFVSAQPPDILWTRTCGEVKVEIGKPLSQQSTEIKKQIGSCFDLGMDIYVWSIEVGSSSLGKALTYSLIQISSYLDIQLTPSPNTITTRKQAYPVMQSYIRIARDNLRQKSNSLLYEAFAMGMNTGTIFLCLAVAKESPATTLDDQLVSNIKKQRDNVINHLVKLGFDELEQIEFWALIENALNNANSYMGIEKAQGEILKWHRRVSEAIKS